MRGERRGGRGGVDDVDDVEVTALGRNVVSRTDAVTACAEHGGDEHVPEAEEDEATETGIASTTVVNGAWRW